MAKSSTAASQSAHGNPLQARLGGMLLYVSSLLDGDKMGRVMAE